MKSKFLTNIYLLLLISLGYIATDIYLPSLPSLTTYFHTTDNEVQLTIFSYLLSFSLTPLIFGPLSDHIGRKKVILGGILTAILASYCSLYATNIHWLIGTRFVQGVGLGAVLISARASVSDLFTGPQLAKQMSLIASLMPFFLAIAPALGGFLQENFGWQSIFVFILCYLMIIFGWIFFIPETLKTPNHKKIHQIFSNFQLHLKNLPFLMIGINFILPSLGLFTYLTTSSFLFQEMIGLSPIEYGVLSLYIGITIFVTGMINLKLIQYLSTFHILYVGTALIILSGSLLIYFHMASILTFWALLIPSLIYFTCLPLCIANAASTAMNMVKSHFGSASALLTTFQFLIGSLGSFIFTLIPDNSLLPLGICFFSIGILCMVNLSLIRKIKLVQEFSGV